jgi:hypothetical protein
MLLRSQRGQSTVEFALCLPFVAIVVAVVFQAGMVAVNNGRLWHAAREAVRVAAVDGERAAIQQAAETSGLSPLEIEVDPAATDRALGDPVSVTVRYPPGATLPLLGRVLEDVNLTATATMRIETP